MTRAELLRARQQAAVRLDALADSAEFQLDYFDQHRAGHAAAHAQWTSLWVESFGHNEPVEPPPLACTVIERQQFQPVL